MSQLRALRLTQKLGIFLANSTPSFSINCIRAPMFGIVTEQPQVSPLRALLKP